MLTGLVQNLRLTAEARTGLSSAVVVFALIAAIAVGRGVRASLSFAAFIWLAERYSPLTAALIVAVAFVLVAIICAIGAVHGATPHQRARQARAGGAQPVAMVRSRDARRSRCRSAAASVCGGSFRSSPPVCSPPALAKEWFRDRPDDEP